MCLAIPGQIEKIEGDTAIIDYWVEKRKAKVIGNYKEGDYVIAQAGVIVMKVSEEQAKASLEAYSKLKS